MSLLDDVSIVVTPNGYKAGTLYGVLPVPTVGNELVTDGSNANAGANWNANTNWNKTVAGVFSCDGSSLADINQTNTLAEVGKQYILSFEVLSINAGGVLVIKFGGAVGTDRTAVGVYSEIITATSTDRIRVKADSANTVGSVTGISVKEWTASDMDVTRATAATRVDENGLVNYAEILGSELVTNGDFTTDLSGWSGQAGRGSYAWDNGRAKITNDDASSYPNLSQSITTVVGKVYKITATVEIGTATLIEVRAYSNSNIGSKQLTTDGTIEFYITADDTDFTLHLYLFETGNTGHYCYFDNISVKESARDNVPRIDYTGGGCPHILSEPQRTNLITYSEDLSVLSKVSVGTASAPVTTSNYATAPDGTQTATRVVFNLNGGTSSADRSILRQAIPSGSDYYFSIYVKSTDGTEQKILWHDGGEYNLTTVTNEWVRITYDGRTNLVYAGIALRGGEGVDSSDILTWGFQVETGSYPTSYIPTSGSTVTRNQDVFTRDGISSLINSTEGVLFAEISALADDSTQRAIGLSNGTGDERIAIVYNDASNVIRLFCKSGGVTTSIIYSSGTIVDYNKIAVKWNNGNDYALWVNGIEVGTSVTGSSFPTNTLSELSFSFFGTNTPFYGKVKQLQVYDTALTDNQLIQLTGEAGTHFFESYSEMAETLTYTIQ